jgi:hypothetical protein
VPAIYAGGLSTVIVGGALDLGGARGAGSVVIVSGVAVLTCASLAMCRADRASRRAPPAHVTEPHDLLADADASPALDAPATALALLGTAVILASAALGTASLYGARVWPPLAALLFLCGAAVVLCSTALHLAAEVQRGSDVATIARALRGAGGGGGGGGGAWRAICAAAAAHEAAPRPSPLRACCAPRAPLAELRLGLSPLIFSALAANFFGALCLVASAALQLGGAGDASLVVLIVSFAGFIAGVALVIHVGPRRVAAHRRGGRAHLEYDVGRALEGWV